MEVTKQHVVDVLRTAGLPEAAADADRHESVEGPRALVGVLGTARVVPGVELRIGQHFAELVSSHVCERRKALATAEAGGSPGIAARIAVQVEEETELHPGAVDRA